MKPVRNIAASARQRLLDRARKERRPFNELLQYYAMERFLYRLSRSRYAEQFILKGALMLRVWQSPELRPTMDIDMLGRMSNDESTVVAQIRAILEADVEGDGVIFDADTVLAERIVEDAHYEGIRIRLRGVLDSARVSLQIDIGFGDIIYPRAELHDFPTLLGSPAPRLLCYSRESVIAEKFAAMVKLGRINSRMKDFYDIWSLSRLFNFDGADLAESIRLTFERRDIALSEDIEGFTRGFSEAKQMQWEAFRRRVQLDQAPELFCDVVAMVESFLSPIVAALVSHESTSMRWTASGAWTETEDAQWGESAKRGRSGRRSTIDFGP